MYLSQKTRNSEMRAQVEEMFSKGEKVKCGFITEDTRVSSNHGNVIVINQGSTNISILL